MGAFERDYSVLHILVSILKSSFYSGPMIDNKRTLNNNLNTV